ncbi:serine/threonine-protein kinase pim-1-like [Enoplosus armatus]|uniref:serine/threonine-protein kinase pim-1-like n=1 Tax=Enoplosus armatus TaxID=215367 RepID=UPI0039918B93
MTQQSAASPKDSRTGGTKRKASPDTKTPRKRTRVSEFNPQSRAKEDLRVRLLKRKIREDGEGPLKKKRKGLDHNQLDEESASSSVDTCRESSSSSPLEGCSTPVEDVSKPVRKRKATAEGEGPRKKKRKRSPERKETKEATKEEPKEESKEEPIEKKKEETKKFSINVLRAEFVAKYEQQNQLGAGGCGSVFAGYRKADNLPVAIKRVPRDKVLCKQLDKNGRQLSVEVAIMLKLAAETTGSVGSSAAVSLLDWYDLGKELVLVQERPIPSQDLDEYIYANGGSLQEEEAKLILKQLVDAAKDLQDKQIFHRDIKVENILIETGSDVPRVRLIDFGLSCFVKKKSVYRVFYGTLAHTPPEWHSQSTYRAGPTTVWQMGVVLFEMLHRKFETIMFLRNKLKISNNLSSNCKDFLQLCLTEAPEQRPTLEELQHHPWLR